MFRDHMIDDVYLILREDSHKGSQVKYYKDGVWYKINHVGNEALAEYLVSIVLKHSNITNYVEYDMCYINGKLGCKSNNFLVGCERFVSFKELYKYATGGDLTNRIQSINSVQDRFNYIVEFIYNLTELDVRDYISNIVALGMLTLNVDRHMNNLGIIDCGNGLFRESPIFDNGQSLFQNNSMFVPNDYENNIIKATSATISGNFEQQFLACKPTLKINYNTLLKELRSLDRSAALSCLLKQLNKYEKIFNINK